MTLHISKELNKNDKQYIDDELYRFNLKHFPKDLGGRYEEINLFLKDEKGKVRGGILSAVCWNWLEIYTVILDEDIRHSGYGTKLLLELEKIALDKKCDFIKVDTLSFQALDFYKKNGYQVFGSIDNVGRDFEHYYLKKDLKVKS
ncbi:MULTISPECIES: GNAT family N-acetyltransferase [Bacillus]|uniref:GNAT family acetyltransferase n=1 Tax=Bacillus proteolyticus TaxID=2026192 RepID=A0AA44KZ38_9BACI|nr:MULTISPECIES: GNAT family N-acetyltransferase [Bacillus]OJE50546.1 GNAT family acetyltransferase [Bacillus proteolyticus]QWH38262.1 GNAT family N-acetyltransferase [Bacillus mycoides]